MRRLTLALCCLAALAADDPEPGGSFDARTWKTVVPRKDCELSFSPGRSVVTFKVLGAEGRPRTHQRGASRWVVPRLEREAPEGDFDMQARVRLPVSQGEIKASLFAFKDGKDGEGVFWAGAFCEEGSRHAAGEMVLDDAEGRTRDGASLPPHKVKAGGKELWEVYLKVERRGAELKAYLSLDGKRWSRLKHFRGDKEEPRKLAGKLKVGVAVVGNTKRASEVTFDQFKLTPVKARPKD